MEYRNTALNILNAIGGEKNIINVTHCATRLRLKLKDLNIVSDEILKSTEGVIGVLRKNDQYQIILGNDVANYYKEFIKLGNFELSNISSDKKGSILSQIIEYIVDSITPVIPALLGGGMLKVLVIILPMLGIFKADSQTISFLNFFGDAPYYFMPIFLAYSASKKLNINTSIAMSVGGILLHPSFIQMISTGNELKLFGAIVTPASYGSSIIPILITIYLMKYIEKFFNKITPAGTKSFLQPTLLLLVSGFIAIVLIGPLGVIIGKWLSILITQTYSINSWITLTILGITMPFIVMTGMHWAFAPIILTASITTPDVLILPAMLGSNLAQGAASMAVAFKSENNNTRQVAFTSGFSALFAGITEPALYGVTLKYKKPLYAAMIGGGLSGLYVGLTGVKSYIFVVPSIIGLPQFIYSGEPKNIVNALIAAAISIIVTFVLAYILGIDEENDKQDLNNVKSGISNKKNVYAPISGKVISLEKVNDSTFSNKLLGDGIAIIPKDGKVYAPFNGIVSSVFPTKHAITLKSDEGVELLIHMGLETVKLEGKGFESKISEGNRITKGDLILEMDLETILSEGYEIITPIIVTNTQDYLDILLVPTNDEIIHSDELLAII